MLSLSHSQSNLSQSDCFEIKCLRLKFSLFFIKRHRFILSASKYSHLHGERAKLIGIT
ncbi:unnamed protein product [Larinioides sclopetarius]|uniref:Uncharacterized protein n=1 Tax=Larinioides sclopetarius TaxID=280406 RepID=A0AAV2A6I4_9ARAC